MISINLKIKNKSKNYYIKCSGDWITKTENEKQK